MKSLHAPLPFHSYQVHPELERLARALRGLATPSGLRATAVGLIGVAVASAAIGELDGLADVPSAVMLSLLPILFVGGRWGTAPAVVAAVAAFLLHDFFHVEPVGSLWHTGK